MDLYHLDPDFGVTVDYWANSMQMYIVCGDMTVYRGHNASKGGNKAKISTEPCIIPKWDLLVNKKERKTCLFLRFKNCTGNIIDLTIAEPKVDPFEMEQSKLTLSIDPLFKKVRNRTVK